MSAYSEVEDIRYPLAYFPFHAETDFFVVVSGIAVSVSSDGGAD